MSRSASADSKASDWPLVRKSTATSEAGDAPAATRSAISAAMPAASAGSSGKAVSAGSGPAARCASQLDAVPAASGRRARARRGWPARRPAAWSGSCAPAARPGPRGAAGWKPRRCSGAGPGERVDGLGRVADDAEVVALPQPQVEQRCWSGLTSWYSSTTKWRYCWRTARAMSSRSARIPTVSEQDVLEVDDPAVGLDLLVGLEQPRHRRWRRARRGSRRAAAAAAAYVSGVSMRTFAHSTSAARSRMPVRSSCSRSEAAASATAARLVLMTSGAAPPMACGQK